MKFIKFQIIDYSVNNAAVTNHIGIKLLNFSENNWIGKLYIKSQVKRVSTIIWIVETIMDQLEVKKYFRILIGISKSYKQTLNLHLLN